MKKEKITIVITTLLALASIAIAGYALLDTQKKEVQIKSLEGKEQQAQVAAVKSSDALSEKEKTIAELKAALEKRTSDVTLAEEKIRAFALQASACEAIKASSKKH